VGKTSLFKTFGQSRPTTLAKKRQADEAIQEEESRVGGKTFEKRRLRRWGGGMSLRKKRATG